MASKVVLLMMACFLLVNTKVSAEWDEEILAEAPVHAPAKAPFHAPRKALAHAPIHAPAQSPVHAYSPVSPPHGCVAMCASYCKAISPKRPCMRTCTSCCSKSKCVPGFMKCSSWDKVTIHGHLVKCP